MTVPLRKRVKRSVRSALVRAVVGLLSLVPLRPALVLATLVGRVGWRAARRTRAQILAQLAVAFPEKTLAEREAIGRASLVHLAKLEGPDHRAPVLAGWSRRRGPGPRDGHVIDFVEVPYDPAPEDREAEVVRLTAACTALFEKAIRASPAEWVWMHERWKTRPEVGASAPQAKAVPKTVELSSG